MFKYIILSQCNTLVNSAALTRGLASQLSLLFTLARPTTKLVIVNNSSMKTITGDTRTLDFFKSTSWSRIWFEFLGTLRLLCWDLMFGQANNQLHIADRVGTVCVDSTMVTKHLLGMRWSFADVTALLLKYYWMVILPLQPINFQVSLKLEICIRHWMIVSRHWWLFPTSDWTKPTSRN